SDVSLPDTTQNYNLSSIQLSGYYNQSFSRRAQKGWVIQPYAEFSGFLSMADFSFQKISLDVRRYTPLTSTTTLATRIQRGMIFATQEDSLPRSEEHTSELQSRFDLVCRLLLEKKKKIQQDS